MHELREEPGNRNAAVIFTDRRDAGRRLARRLERFRALDTFVLAIPRGGVVVGYEVGRALGAPLDVTIPRKLGAPGQPELAIGAVAGGVLVLDEESIRYLNVPPGYIEEEAERQRREIDRRLRLYRGARPFPEVSGGTVILVDDGIATGSTVLAAARALRERSPGRLVLAAPVAPPETAARLSREVDELIVLQTPEPFLAVGNWYLDFEQVSDEEVISLLHSAENGYT